jgi:hypothetical protein
LLDGEGPKAITEEQRIEDRNHIEALVPRIYELISKLPFLSTTQAKEFFLKPPFSHIFYFHIKKRLDNKYYFT